MEENRMSRKGLTLLSWMDRVIENYIRQNSLGTAGNYQRTRRSLQSWLQSQGRKDIPMSRIDREQVAHYQDWLTVEGKCRNTRSFHLRNFRSAYNMARKDGLLPLTSTDVYPFGHISTSCMPTHRRASEAELIERLERLDIARELILLGKDEKRKSFGKMVHDLTFARDIFVFCFYACGLPFVDFAYLTPDDIRDGMLRYQRHKTGTYVEMEILPQMRRIIRHYANDGHYLFPILTAITAKEAYGQYTRAIRRYNHRLELLSQMLHVGIALSTYAPRHTWANAVYHNGMPESCIKERLGHVSLHTTQSYLKSFESSKIDEMNKQILETLFKKCRLL